MEQKTKFRVFKANILDDDGNKILADEVVELSPKLARHYNKLGFLRPYFEDDEDDEDDDEVEAVASNLRRRVVNRGETVGQQRDADGPTPGQARRPPTHPSGSGL